MQEGLERAGSGISKISGACRGLEAMARIVRY